MFGLMMVLLQIPTNSKPKLLLLVLVSLLVDLTFIPFNQLLKLSLLLLEPVLLLLDQPLLLVLLVPFLLILETGTQITLLIHTLWISSVWSVLIVLVLVNNLLQLLLLLLFMLVSDLMLLPNKL